MLLQCILDLRPRLKDRVLQVDPMLPDLFSQVDLLQMRLGNHHVDLRVRRSDDGVTVNLSSGKIQLQVGPPL